MADIKMTDRNKLTITEVDEIFNATKYEVIVSSSDGPIMIRGKAY